MTQWYMTPEMIKAGMDVLGLYDSEWDSSEEFLKEIYEAMCEAKQKEAMKDYWNASLR